MWELYLYYMHPGQGIPRTEWKDWRYIRCHYVDLMPWPRKEEDLESPIWVFRRWIFESARQHCDAYEFHICLALGISSDSPHLQGAFGYQNY